MSANSQTAAMAGWPGVTPILLSSSGWGTSAAVFGSVRKRWLRAHQLLEALKGSRRKDRGNGGGPEPPSEEDFESYSIWDDPLLLTLMMH